jgi:S-adenosyl-L-methionine hydrolase (adenosine-forming)
LKPTIITLLTDFGSQDYFVGAMKGAILAINPAARIVDVTHEIPPADIRAAAFNLLAVHDAFSPGTIHVAVVDPGVGSARRGIIVECAGQFFVGPDNGLLSWICERAGAFQAVHLTNEKFFRQPVSQTFHGRDIFAPVAAALSVGVALKEFGPVINDLIHLESLKPRRLDDGGTEAWIIHIDRFGNCITNLTRDDFDAGQIGAEAKLLVSGHEVSAFRDFFANSGAEPSELFGLFGSAGFLEIAAQDSSAAKILGAQRGQKVIALAGRVDRDTIGADRSELNL